MPNTEKLQEYFDFTPGDLRENRQGHVTETQRALLKSRAQSFNIRAMIMLLVVGAPVVAIFFIIKEELDTLPPVAFIVPVATVLPLVVFFLHRANKMKDVSLQQVEGAVNFVWVESQVRRADDHYRTETSLKMHVDEISFNVDESLIGIINQGDNVRFYYAGGSGDILSAEFLDKP